MSTLMANREFLAGLDPGRGVEAVLDHLPDVTFWVKDTALRFVLCNRAFLTLVGLDRPQQVIGRSDLDFFPRHLCEGYARDDAEVMRTGRPLVDRIELVRKPDGSIDWYNTTKLPVYRRNGRVAGVAGLTRDVRKMKSTNERFLTMAPVIETIVTDYARPLSVRALASRAELSVSQFERRFRGQFHTTPLKYLTQIRINAACQLLTSTDMAITDVALEVGFCDQSHFTHQFVKHKGLTPGRYRKLYAAPALG